MRWCGRAGAGPRCRGRAVGPGCAASGRQGGGGGAVLHIRSGPTSDGSAESCENSSVLNAVEILPCAEGPALHMGAHPLKTDILEDSRNHAENPEPARAGAALQCAAPPHGPGRTVLASGSTAALTQRPRTGREEPQAPRLKTAPAATPPQPATRPAAALRQDPAVNPNLIRTPRETAPPPHRPLGHRSWRERVNDAIPRERRNRRAPESHAPTTFLSHRTARHWPDRASHPGEHVRKRQQGLRSRPPLRGAG